MSHNGPYSGPPWSGGRPEEPYAEPSDPWGESSRAVNDPAWGSPQIPHQQFSGSPAASAPGPAAGRSGPSRRGFAVGALIAVLSVLVGGGLATTVWYVLGRKDRAGTAASTPPAGVTVPRVQPSADARFANRGQCIRNEGTNAEPQLRIVACAANTYEVLKRVDGRTTGEKDAIAKCAKVPGYTKWYYYDTEYDDVDFVLCLREYQPE
ncbi:hypothetical protein ACWT_8195 [Actinoplanes sp. SE50]|uniref:LppU/SCO3897 family protein n=1 Tax=unclassified Actinoplanes TaxID=2626549 RepID=UPI00023EDDA7|nr:MULTISPECIES: hypothetical protein [unclassified Actinoplanes]AEV89202.1 hypothetical protein ACPL_8326 [Actinoplanes sp. SE50/110]ATO87610.1 hypothetical protein ACWT_8195 [Actinoplanes sp. SE50]SLM05028.1 hypothetical protein ACSP50_8343 [Actinoplanes sp. SE50/110]